MEGIRQADTGRRERLDFSQRIGQPAFRTDFVMMVVLRGRSRRRSVMRLQADEIHGIHYAQVLGIQEGVPIKDADIQQGSLRYLDQVHLLRTVQHARFDQVPLSHGRRLRMQRTAQRTIHAGTVQVRRRHLLLQAQVHAGARPDRSHIPEFRLAEGIVPLPCHLVVRADPDRGPAGHLQGTHGHRELTAVIIVHVIPDHAVDIGLHDITQGISRQPAAARLRINHPQIRQLIDFRTPRMLHGNRCEAERIQFLLFFHKTHVTKTNVAIFSVL